MYKGWWIVVTHFVVMFFAVGFYQYSLPLLFPAVIEHFETDAATLNMLLTVHVAVGLLVGPLAGPWVDGWSAKGLLVIGVASFAMGVAILGLAPNVWLFVVGGGLALGVAGTLCGPMTGSAVVSRFFTASRGRALGIASIGTSAGGFVLPPLVTASAASIGWQATVWVVAGAMVAIVLPLVLFRFWNTPEDAGTEIEPSPAGVGGVADDHAAMSTREILTHRAFWLFTIPLALFISVYTSTLFNLGLHFTDRGLETGQIAAMMSLAAASGIAGKLGFGEVADRVPLKLAFIAAIAATAGALMLLLAEPGVGVLYGTMALLGLSTGGLLPVWNALVPRLFGVANFGRAMGWMGPVIAFTTMSVYPAVGLVRDATGSYAAVFQGDLVALALAVALVIPLHEGRA